MPLAFLLVLSTLYVFTRAVFVVLSFLGYVDVKRHWVPVVVTLFVFLLIAMQSLGQLSIRDILVLLPATGLAYFYYSIVLSKNSFTNNNL